MFFNTNKEVGKELEISKVKAVTQDEEILTIFIENQDRSISAWDITEFLAYPITSIRRGINTLYKQGKLLKSNKTKIGVYGKKCLCWKLNTSTEQLNMFN